MSDSPKPTPAREVLGAIARQVAQRRPSSGASAHNAVVTLVELYSGLLAEAHERADVAEREVLRLQAEVAALKQRVEEHSRSAMSADDPSRAE